MSSQNGNSIFEELDNRLDDFFAEDNDFLSEESIEDSEDEMGLLAEDFEESTKNESKSGQSFVPPVKDNPGKSPLDTLKAVVLEMDWEINDENLNVYLKEINHLKTEFEADRALFLFFKLHTAIGKYMIHKKAGAHPEALKFLYQVFNSLEKAFVKDISTYDKNRLVLTEVTNFKNLKALMFPDKYSPVESQFVPEIEPKKKKPDFSSLPKEIQKEINEYIEREISMKIDELRNRLSQI